MPVYRITATVTNHGALTIKHLPFEPGDQVEVVVRRSSQAPAPQQQRYPLRGTSIRYLNPFGSVAEEDWEVLQ
jgi:hypothetical protein